MAVTVASLISRVRDVGQDRVGVQWSDAEILRWLGDAQRAVANFVPGATSKEVKLNVIAGARQELATQGASDAFRLISVLSNAGVYGTSPNHIWSPIRRGERMDLEESVDDWMKPVDVGSTGFSQWVFDEDDPLAFYLYPAPDDDQNIAVSIVYSAAPDDLTSGGNLGLRDIYVNAVLDYTLSRVFSKQAAFNVGNMELANSHYQRFLASVGVKLQEDRSLEQDESPYSNKSARR